jgi:hypothetical protein
VGRRCRVASRSDPGDLRRGAEIAAARGILIADTKLEFRPDPRRAWLLADEVLTPDSSRFWPADEWGPGSRSMRTTSSSCATGPPARVEQADRRRPRVPADVVAAPGRATLEAYERITGERWDVPPSPPAPARCLGRSGAARAGSSDYQDQRPRQPDQLQQDADPRRRHRDPGQRQHQRSTRSGRDEPSTAVNQPNARMPRASSVPASLSSRSREDSRQTPRTGVPSAAVPYTRDDRTDDDQRQARKGCPAGFPGPHLRRGTPRTPATTAGPT